MGLVLYELAGLDDRRYSQFSWRSRLAIAHKGLTAEIRAVPVRDKQAIAFSRQNKLPVLVDGDTVVSDSWAIAEYLDRREDGGRSLFGGGIGHGLSRFINTYVDRTLLPKLLPLVMIDVMGCVDDEDGRHLRGQIEQAFRRPLEDLAAARDGDIVAFRKLLDPLRATMRAQPFLCGDAPAYADYILFSLFQWARIVSAFEVLEPSDALASWRERMLDLFDGLARREPPRAAAV